MTLRPQMILRHSLFIYIVLFSDTLPLLAKAIPVRNLIFKIRQQLSKPFVGGKNITNLRFAYDMDALAEEEQELDAQVESLDKTCTRYKMEAVTLNSEMDFYLRNGRNGDFFTKWSYKIQFYSLSGEIFYLNIKVSRT